MKKWKEPKTIQKALKAKKEGLKDETVLQFNYKSGDLEIVPKSEQKESENIVVEQIYKDGFFINE